MNLTKVDVIGAGIIGVSTALALQNRGFDVTLIDREGVAAEASGTNAGAFAFSDIVPLATPGIMRKAPGWLLDPLGPLSIPPTYLPKIAPWLIRFWRASSPHRFKSAIKAQVALMRLAREALERQILNVDGEASIQREGQLQLYAGEAEFLTSKPEWTLREKHGIDFTLLTSPDQIADIQPGLAPNFTHAGFIPDWLNTCDPAKWANHLAEVFVSRGGTITRTEVKSLEHSNGRVKLIATTGARAPDYVVVAAGAWSHHLAHTIGDRYPLETERGYNTTLPKGAFDLRTHLTFGGHGFVVSRINGGIRVGGAVELGGLNRPPDYRRAKMLLQKAKAFLPDLQTDGGTQWMGFRPSMPDSLPVIGASPEAARVFYAFGHGHLGLTQSAATAELVCDLITQRKPAIDLTPFSPTRF